MTDIEKLNALGFYFLGEGKDGIKEGYFRGEEVISKVPNGFEYLYAIDDPITGTGATLKNMIKDAQATLKKIYKRQMRGLKALEAAINSVEGDNK